MLSPTISRFRGLHNSNDLVEMGLEWQRVVDNVNITNTGKIQRRDGFSLSFSAVPSGAFTTADFLRMYLVDAGALKQVLPGLTTVTLRSGLVSDPMRWTELNQRVYFTNGTDSGIILADGTVLDWVWGIPAAPTLVPMTGSLPVGQYQVCCTFLLSDGRETGSGDVSVIDVTQGQGIQISGIPQAAGKTTLVYIAPANSQVFQFAFSNSSGSANWNSRPSSLGADLTTHMRRPLPAGASIPASWMGRICATSFFASKNQSAVWMSDALAPHLFDLQSGFFLVPGEVVLLAPTKDALIIGTRSEMFARGPDGALTKIADYGAVPGYNWAPYDDQILMWTSRGVCKAMPFSNLTIDNVSVAPGVRVGACLVQRSSVTFVACLQAGGSPFKTSP